MLESMDRRELPDWLVTAEELRRELEGPGPHPILVDVRQPEEWLETRIEGCQLIPLGELQARAERELDRDDDIVLYCAHGIRSMHALRALQMMGFRKLRSLHGGMAAWLGDPSF